MGTIFKYNNTFYQCQNLQKKLKKLRLKDSDIKIIKDDIPNEILEKEFVALTVSTKKETDDNWFTKNSSLNEQGLPILFYFQNKKTKETICSIFDTLDDLKDIINIEDYEISRS